MTTKPNGEPRDGVVLVGAALDARVLPHVLDQSERLARRRGGVALRTHIDTS